MSTLGMKYECFSCGARFYDLGKPEAICPKCGANQKDAKRTESASEAAAAKRKRRDDVARLVDQPEEEVATPAAEDEFVADDEIEVPEGVEVEEEEPEDDEV
jgi:hypothetical protein